MNKLPMLTKSFLGFSIFLVIPLVIAGFIFNYNMIRYSEQEISKSSIVNLQNVKKLNDQLVDSITKQSIRLSLDVVLQDIGGINDYKDLHNNVDDMLKLSKVYNILQQTTNINFHIQSIYVYLEDSNYVITSNHGFIMKDEFKDTGWIKQYEDSKDMATGTIWLDSRPLNGVSSEPSVNSNVLTFILPLRNIMVNYNGAVVVNIYERELYSLMNGTADERDGAVIIINNKGKVVSHYDKPLIRRDISKRPYISKILDSADETGYFVDSSESDKKMYTFYKSDFNNWIYIGDISVKSLIANTSTMRNGILLLIIVLMLSGIVFSYFFSRNMYNPVNKLINDIKKLKGIDIREKGNEMAVISNAFDSLVKREINLNDELERGRQAIKNKFIADLLQGDIEETDDYSQLIMQFPFKYFECILIAVDRYEVFVEKYSHEQQYYMKLMILEACSGVMPDNFIISGILYEKSMIALLVNCDSPENQHVRNNLYSSFARLQSEIGKVLGNTISVGIGKCCDNIADIPVSFNQAHEALKNRIIKGGGCIEFFDEALGESIKTGYFYPYKSEKHILNFLKLSLKTEVMTSIDDLIEEMKEHKGLTSDNMLQSFIQLVGNTVKYLTDININVSNIFGHDYNIYQKLSSKETLDDISTWLKGFYSGILQYVSSIYEEEKSSSASVLDYIHKNFRLNIDTTSIADGTGLSYSSIGRIMRNKTGKNVLEYINGLRIDEAKRLLQNTNMNLREIAANVGYNNDQSFLRFFKKYEGLTPGEFRSIKG